MRLAIALFAIPAVSMAQFRSTVPLVLAPVTITDSQGNYVNGLSVNDLILYDNNVPRKIQLDWTEYPISLVVAVQTSSNSGPVIDKLGGSGILFTQLIAAAAGETSLLTFSDRVKVRQEFTSDADQITRALRMLRKEEDGPHSLDALAEAASMLAKRSTQRRRIVLMIAEKRDRGSESKLPDVVEQVERSNTTVYWLTFSPFLQPFTEKRKTMEDLKPEAERNKGIGCALCPPPDDRAAPLDLGPGGIGYAIGELIHLRRPDIAALFANSTGGRTLAFLKKSALESTIARIGEEVHRQYIVSFTPPDGPAGEFHAIRVAVRNRPELRVTTRAGYWSVR